MKLFFALLSVFAVVQAQAAIYHCVDSDGRKTLRDSPCDGTAVAKAPEPAPAPAVAAKPKVVAPKAKAAAAVRNSAAGAAQ